MWLVNLTDKNINSGAIGCIDKDKINKSNNIYIDWEWLDQLRRTGKQI